MRIAISTARQAHYKLPANAFARRGHKVTIYSSTPTRRFRGFDPSLGHRFVPAPVTLINALTRIPFPVWMNELDSAAYDQMAAMRLAECELFLGAATSSLSTGKAAQRRGGTFVLDRACPDIRYQQTMLAEEAKKAGGVFRRNTQWFVERQVEEYEQADLLLMPSNYSRNSYPEHIRSKTILAPLCGRTRIQPRVGKPAGSPFVVGVVGGDPLRKGYLYLLQAWKELALPNAQLQIRSGDVYRRYATLARLVDEQPSVRMVPYVPDISEFYAQCDAFILSSVDDGFGMALFEAMANGVPSIATHTTGASELLADGRDALLIDAWSVDAIKESLGRLYESAELRDELGRNGQAAVSSLMEGETARLYEEGIGRLLERVKERASAAAV